MFGFSDGYQILSFFKILFSEKKSRAVTFIAIGCVEITAIIVVIINSSKTLMLCIVINDCTSCYCSLRVKSLGLFLAPSSVYCEP